jgi:uncharacterized protein (TIGR03435 family)
MTLTAYCRLGFLVLGLITLGLSAKLSASAQTDTKADAAYVPTLTFDVVSIHESKDDISRGFSMGGPNSPHASLVSVTNYSAADLIGMAYGIDSRHVSGAPDWASSTRFYVKGNSDSSVDDKLAKLSDKQGEKEKQHMLQVMLADRFQLKVHQVVRDATVYDLVVAKNGSKLKKSQPPAASDSDPANSRPGATGSKPMLTMRCGSSGCEMTATGYAAKDIARTLHAQMITEVTDKTGLDGVYDFTLQFSSESLSARPDAAADDGPWPLLSTAVKEQLGLELKPAKGTSIWLVIDHIEKPSEN